MKGHGMDHHYLEYVQNDVSGLTFGAFGGIVKVATNLGDSRMDIPPDER